MSHRKEEIQAPIRFEWMYRGQPEPGLRRWYREGSTWSEVYPSGKTTHFTNVSAAKDERGATGTLITKEDGYQLFFPDVTANNLRLLGPYPGSEWSILGNAGNQSWNTLSEMKKIVPPPNAREMPLAKPHSTAKTKKRDLILPILDLVLQASAKAAQEQKLQQKPIKKAQATPTFFEAKKQPEDLKKAMTDFGLLLENLGINTPQEYKNFQQSELYQQGSLDEYAKSRLFQMHLEKLKINTASQQLVLDSDSNEKEDYIPKLS